MPALGRLSKLLVDRKERGIQKHLQTCVSLTAQSLETNKPSTNEDKCLSEHLLARVNACILECCLFGSEKRLSVALERLKRWYSDKGARYRTAFCIICVHYLLSIQVRQPKQFAWALL